MLHFGAFLRVFEKLCFLDYVTFLHKPEKSFKNKNALQNLQDLCIWMHQTSGYRRETTLSSPPRSYGV